MALWTLWSHLLFRSRHYMCCFPDNSHFCNVSMNHLVLWFLCERELSVFAMWYYPWPFFLLLWSTLETWKGQRPSPNWAKMQDARSEWSRATSLFQSSRGWDMDDGILWSASLTVAFFFRQRIYPVLSFSSSGKAWKHVTNRIDKHMYLFIALSIIIRSPVYLKIERLSTTILITRVFVLRFCIGEPWAETYLFLASWHAFLSIQRVTLLVCSVGNWWIRQLRSCLSWLLDHGLFVRVSSCGFLWPCRMYLPQNWLPWSNFVANTALFTLQKR